MLEVIVKSSIDLFLSNNFNLLTKQRGLPSVGSNPVLHSFSPDVEKINEAFKVYGNENYHLDKLIDETLPKNSLGGGSPLYYKPFPLCVSFMKESFRKFNYSEYPLAAGEEYYRQCVIEYLKQDNYVPKDLFNQITEDNVIFTTSTTQAFNYIIQTLCRPNDVIIMTAPNYGLFSFVPERQGVTVKLLELKEKNKFLPNANELEKLIIDTNKLLNKKFKGEPYIPRVVAFLNINPHNPLGTVMGEKEISLLQKIGKVCNDNSVFVIDDLIYRDLSFPNEEIAKPVASLKGMFNNTITMFGLSKAYGLAGLRAGIVFANASIIRGIRNCIFQQMDSPPLLQASALAGAFNSTSIRNKIYNKYFSRIRKIYLYRYNLLKALIDGIESVDLKYHSKIKKELKKHVKNKEEVDFLLKGIKGIHLLKNLTVRAGFFALIDFTDIKGKSARGYVISDEMELLKYLYQYGRIKFIIGKSMGWANNKQIIARVTYALETKKIILAMIHLNKLIGELK